MAIVIACDCCGAQTKDEKEFESAGVVLPRQYCEACLPKVQEFKEEVDKLHDACVEKWEKGYTKLKKKYAHIGALPDVED